MLQNDVGLTPDDLALIAGDSPDLAVRAKSKVTLCQTNSPELAPGDKRQVKGATVGSFVVPSGDERVAVDHVDFIVVGFSHYFDEYLPSRGPYVATHLKKPPGAIWLNAKRDKVEKTGLWLPNGNRVVEVILAYLLLLPDRQGASFAFYGSGFPIGRDLSDRAASLKATIGAESVSACTLGKWRLTATFEKDTESDHRWCEPAVTLIGKLGEPKGPTVAEWRLARTLRRAIKDGTPWQEAQTSLLPQPEPAKPKLAVVEPTPTFVEPRLTAAERAAAWAEGPPEPDPDDPGNDGSDIHYPDQEEVED
jgi:hypothetical protein